MRKYVERHADGQGSDGQADQDIIWHTCLKIHFLTTQLQSAYEDMPQHVCPQEDPAQTSPKQLRPPDRDSLFPVMYMTINLAFVLVVVLLVFPRSALTAYFTYNRLDLLAGPNVWGDYIKPECNYRHQSPININTGTVIYGYGFELDFEFQNSEIEGTFGNNGHAAQFTPAGQDNLLTGVPYREDDYYQLAQFHFHFGRNDWEGSEHLINGRAYAGEAHLVYFNRKYGNLYDAMKHEDGLAVVATLITSAYTSNIPRMDAFLRKNLPLIQNHDDQVMAEVTVTDLIPSNKEFYTYLGSLTTPPCTQVVRWIVFRQPVSLSWSTFSEFRALNGRKWPMGRYGNFRPVQSVNGRIVEANF